MNVWVVGIRGRMWLYSCKCRTILKVPHPHHMAAAQLTGQILLFKLSLPIPLIITQERQWLLCSSFVIFIHLKAIPGASRLCANCKSTTKTQAHVHCSGMLTMIQIHPFSVLTQWKKQLYKYNMLNSVFPFLYLIMKCYFKFFYCSLCSLLFGWYENIYWCENIYFFNQNFEFCVKQFF